MALSALLLAASLAAPELTAENITALQRAYPREARPRRESAGTVVQAEVAPDGKVLACRQLALIGSRTIGDKVCGMVTRQKLKPAVGPDQKPVHGVVITLVQHVVPETPQGKQVEAQTLAPDVELQVANLPSDAGAAVNVAVDTLIDSAGSMSLCEPGAEAPAGYATVVCQQLKTIRYELVKNAKGTPVPYVRHFDVKLARAATP